MYKYKERPTATINLGRIGEPKGIPHTYGTYNYCTNFQLTPESAIFSSGPMPWNDVEILKAVIPSSCFASFYSR